MSDYIIHYRRFVQAYSLLRKIPIWTLERITRDTFTGGSTRRDGGFRRDPDLLQIFQSNWADYQLANDIGLDRGHAAAAGNHTANYDEYQSTYWYSNCIPMDKFLNVNPWTAIEREGRNACDAVYLADPHGDVFVLTVCAFRRWEDIEDKNNPRFHRRHAGNNRMMTFHNNPNVQPDGVFVRTFGTDEEHPIHVPTHFIKIICTRRPRYALAFQCYAVENRGYLPGRTPDQFVLTLEEAEALGGFNFQEIYEQHQGRLTRDG